MLIRVDEFPRCDQSGRLMFDPWVILGEFMATLRAPFCLAVVVGSGLDDWATGNDLERLRKLDGVTLAAHGFGHVRYTFHSPSSLAELAKFFPSGIAVPPFNGLNQATVGALAQGGFKYVCTGPETRRDCDAIRFDGIREVPSAYYGHLCDSPTLLDADHKVPFGVLDCVTLHSCWESCTAPRFEYLQRFADIYRDEIVPWSALIGGNS